MKHCKSVSRPAMALSETHPDIKTSIEAFLDDPIGTVKLHFEQDS